MTPRAQGRSDRSSMSDIVERLRDVDSDMALSDIRGRVLLDAADEIERLTKERDALRQTLADLASKDPFAAHAESDHSLAYENEAENARLREALQRIAENAKDMKDPNAWGSVAVARSLVDAARALLDHTEAPSESGPTVADVVEVDAAMRRQYANAAAPHPEAEGGRK